MALSPCIQEFRETWLPCISDSGLDRLIDLLERGSPLLINGAFTRALPMGCLATHIAWHHPATEHLNTEAGIMWLSRVARLNPATSQVIRAWDSRGPQDWELRLLLLELLADERARRRRADPHHPEVQEHELLEPAMV